MDEFRLENEIKEFLFYKEAQAATPSNPKKEEDSGIFGKLTQGIKNIISPKDKPDSSIDEEPRTPEVTPPEGWAYVSTKKAWSSLPSINLAVLKEEGVDLTDPTIGLGNKLLLVYDKKSKAYFVAAKESDNFIQVISSIEGEIPIDATPEGAVTKFFTLLGSSLGYKKQEGEEGKSEAKTTDEDKLDEVKKQIDLAKKLVDLQEKVESIEEASSEGEAPAQSEEKAQTPEEAKPSEGEEKPASSTEEQAKEPEVQQETEVVAEPSAKTEQQETPAETEKAKEDTKAVKEEPQKPAPKNIYEAIAQDYRPALSLIDKFITDTEKQAADLEKEGDSEKAWELRNYIENAKTIRQKITSSIGDAVSGTLAETVKFNIKVGSPLRDMLSEAYGFPIGSTSHKGPGRQTAEPKKRRTRQQAVTEQLKQAYELRKPVYGKNTIESLDEIPDEKVRNDIVNFIESLTPESLAQVGVELVENAAKYNPYYDRRVDEDNIPDYKPYSSILKPISDAFEDPKGINEAVLANIKNKLLDAALSSQSSRYILHQLAS